VIIAIAAAMVTCCLTLVLGNNFWRLAVTTLMMIDSSLGLKSSDCGTSGGRNTWLIRYVTASGLRTTWSGLSPIAAAAMNTTFKVTVTAR